MKSFNYQKNSFIMVVVFSVPFYMYGNGNLEILKKNCYQTNTDTLQLVKYAKTEDALGKKYYNKWLKLKAKVDLDSANTHFVNSFNYLPELQKHNYSLEKARLFHQNIEESNWVKEWYLKSIQAFAVRSPQNVEELLKKYIVIEEFVKLYARTYGKCDDALEILQDYKGDLHFYYIEKNPKEKKYTELMEHLKIEEHFLIFDCNKKTK